jgi:hypothetical protein
MMSLIKGTQTTHVDIACRMKCGLSSDIGYKRGFQNICVGLRVTVGVGIRVIVGVCVDAQQAYCGCYGKLARFVRYLFDSCG